MNPVARRLTTTLLALALAGPAFAAEPATRPRVGLVLGGGGARGAAHVGVLEVLEELRVPVDCVAGTSMGALVAGAWTAGRDPAALRRELAAADWADMFQDNPDYADLNFRNKRLSQRFLPGSEAGVSARGVVAPPGVLSGQKIKLFFNRLVRTDGAERDIETLPLPLAIIATDIASGDRVVFRAGSLTQAMRASMSVPGLMAPLDVAGRKLVDGGLVDNLPVQEVRDLCGTQVVIAVDVGSPLLKAEEIGGLLSVSAQMVNILTEQNVSQSRALLTRQDLLLKPDLGGISATDFDRSSEAADRGRAAALALAPSLRRLALPEEDYAAWRDRLAPARPGSPRVDAIEVTGLARVNPDAVRRYVQQPPGQPLDTATLEVDLLRAYGDGWYESVDYALVPQPGRNLLRITPLEKRWGPDYLRLGLNLNSNFSQGSTYALRAGYQRTWINRLGGELLFTGEIGSNAGASAEWMQPLDGEQRFFVSTGASYRRERRDVFQDDLRIAAYTVASANVDLLAGVNLGLLGQLQAGWRDSRRKATLDTGLPILPNQSERFGGWLVALDLDQFNRLYLPTRGWAASASWFETSQRDYARLTADLRGAHAAGPWVLGARVAYTGSPRGTLPYYDAASLGGFLNLSGFASGQLVADNARYAHVRAERIVGNLPLGLRGDLRLGVALEAGRLGNPYTETNRRGWLDSTTLYLGGETPIGPVYLGVGFSSSGSTNAYLFIGTP